MVHIDLPREYSYVIGAGIFSGVVLTYLGSLVGRARAKYGVPLPFLYADQATCASNENARLFNCVQRGHQNAFETYPIVLMMLFTGGLRHPLASAIAMTIWSFGRISFMNGYATGDPKNRTRGGYLYLGLFTLLFTSASAALSIAGVNPLDKKL